MSARHPMAWQDHPAKLAKARELWDQGLTCVQIGEVLHCSKNAVVGAAHRFDFPKRPNPVRDPNPEMTREKRLEGRRKRYAEARLERHKTAVVMLMTDGEGLPQDFPEPAQPRNGGSHICPTDTLPPLASTLGPYSGPPEPPNVPTSRLRPISLKKPLASFLGALMGTPQSCQWPEGDPRARGFRLCGMPAEPGRPYCAAHCDAAYLPLGAKP